MNENIMSHHWRLRISGAANAEVPFETAYEDPASGTSSDLGYLLFFFAVSVVAIARDVFSKSDSKSLKDATWLGHCPKLGFWLACLDLYICCILYVHNHIDTPIHYMTYMRWDGMIWHTYIYTHTCRHIHIHIHTHTQAHTQINLDTRIGIHIDSYIYPFIYLHTIHLYLHTIHLHMQAHLTYTYIFDV